MKGDIVHIEDFKFSDGATGDKYAVILTDQHGTDPILVVKTTSKSKRYASAVRGCNEPLRVFLLPANTRPGLLVDTYIQLDEIFPLEVEDFEEGKQKKKINKKDFLPDQLFNELKNCLKRMKDDIPQVFFNQLFPAKK